MKKIAFALSLMLALSQSTFAQKNTINVASYNLRYNTANDGVNAWPNRKENVKGLIRFHEFDIFGVQEALIGQLKDVAELTEFIFYGKGRDDGKEGGEHSAIFYKKDRFKALQSGDFWLSETPDKPGKGWDATCCNRIASWVKFQDLLSKKEFYFFNVHFDHQGVEARRQSGHLMVKKISEIAGKSTVILTGDFNSTPETEQIKTIQGLLNDSHEVTKQPPYGPEGTFNSFKFDAAMDKRIDYIFVSKNINVLKYGVLTDAKEQRYPSDHQPVLIKVEIK
ncbi:endonuclease/exonuclease/phosphatase family protein [Dyadobacter chenhuakuii]|uniref:Endonuclease/exonuclease/phosphatase family protein n=1 Tax=Dyadobacter chenhuakuii TaxID=2909339 RepID=A0ABY4XNN5_9BACT|nr:endonuclease/exonuclease/phosphatase family protein [Dyadobacter chenhuakuii]MCF2494904.1 endonuclease/exonuclease/phosphatase family protein [Dyadobacter chenhuakuii]USJ31779.1 endonuclease/exonuclease/phosphatase family protein [Dyadobacter chenhuakuii]